MTEFCASLWPEEATPKDQLNCSDCGLIEHGTRMVWGEGNPEAPIMVLLDNPGSREDRDSQPFVCGTRQTLQKAVHEAGLKKVDIYVTFILKRKPVRTYDKEQTRHICMKHLNEQLAAKQPKLVICLGNIAVQSFFNDTEKEVKSLRGGVHDVHGYKTVVAYHPLAVRRRPNLWPLFLEDWKLAAGQFLN